MEEGINKGDLAERGRHKWNVVLFGRKVTSCSQQETSQCVYFSLDQRGDSALVGIQFK